MLHHHYAPIPKLIGALEYYQKIYLLISNIVVQSLCLSVYLGVYSTQLSFLQSILSNLGFFWMYTLFGMLMSHEKVLRSMISYEVIFNHIEILKKHGLQWSELLKTQYHITNNRQE